MNRVLIVTSHSNDAKALTRVLQDARDGSYAIEVLTLLATAVTRIKSGEIDAVLVDLTLSDSKGIATFDQLFAVAPQIPILILSGTEEEELANLAVQRGAQGYLSKGYFESYLVPQSLRNIIQRKAVEESIFMEKARAEITLNSISDAVIGTDMNGNVDYLNVAAEKLTGWLREDARGKPISVVMQIINGATREPRRNPIELVLEQDQEMKLTAGTILIRRDGRECAIEDSAAPIHDSNGQLSGAVIVFHDITDAQAMALKMAYLAQHDFLTNLPNRVLLNDRISQAIAVAERRTSHLAVLFLDLDNFKQINDTRGHGIGDRLLQSVAQRLTACVRRSDTVSRQGGDEFVVLLTEDNFAEDAALTAEKILTAMAPAHVLEGQQLVVTASIGISTYPADGLTAEDLIKHADSAMYQAKERGRNNYQFFAGNMSNQSLARKTMEAELRVALEGHEFVLHYQPKVNLASGAITGTEALLRWNHPQLGQLQPSRFVPIAEDCGLIVEIGRWVLREACKQACQWRESALLCGPMAVNVSALEFRDKGFVASLEAILAQTGLPANALQLELSESALMREAQFSTQVLQQLHGLGVLLAVDEFGTGYSSLTQLAQFPLDVLKIDQSFVQKLDAQDDNRVIVSALIAMGSSLKLRLVAEGVENPAQLAFLKGQRCEEGQGFLFSPPLAAERMSALLLRGIRPLTFSGRE